MEIKEADVFLKEREERLGAKIKFKTYATYYCEVGNEKRENGVFLYTDGKTLVLEDFERVPSIFGIRIPLSNSKKPKYEKLIIDIPISSISQIETVTFKDAEKSFKAKTDVSKRITLFDKAIKRLVTKITLDSKRIIFIELIDKKTFKKIIMDFKEKKDECI